MQQIPAIRDTKRVARGAGRALALAALAFAVAFAAQLAGRGNSGWMYDAGVYRLGAHLALSGADLYPAVARHPFTYPPFAALVFVALQLPPEAVMAICWTALNVACFGFAAWLSLGQVGVREPRRRLLAGLAVCAAAVWLDPIEATLLMGQINLLLLGLVLADLLLPDRSRFKGLLLGIATGIKLEPGLFIVYLLLTRRFAAAARAGAAFAATVAVGFVALPQSSFRYWNGTFLNSRRVGDAANPRSQSIQSLVARWLHADASTALVVGLDATAASVTLAIAVWAHRRGDELLAICVTAAGMLLVSPITWQHHWVWVLPMLIWLGREALARRSLPTLAALALLGIDFLARPYRWIPVNPTLDLNLGWPALLASSTYAAAMLLFVAVAAQHCHQTSTPSRSSGGRSRTLAR